MAKRLISRRVHVIVACLLLSIACSFFPVFDKQEQNNQESPTLVIPSELQIITSENVGKLTEISSIIASEVTDLPSEIAPPPVKTIKEVDGENFAFSPTEMSLIFVSDNGELQFLDIITGEETTLSSGGAIQKIVFSENGKLLAVGRDNGSIELWDMENLTIKSSLEGNILAEHQLSFVANDSLLLLLDDLGGLILWNVSTGAEIWKREGTGIFLFVDYSVSQDGKYLAVADYKGSIGYTDTINLVELASGKVIRTFTVPDGFVTTFIFTPDTKNLIVSNLSISTNSSRLMYFDLSNGQQVEQYEIKAVPNRMMYFDDGKTIAFLGESHFATWDAEKRVEGQLLDEMYFGTPGQSIKLIDQRYLSLEYLLFDTWQGKLIEANTLFVSDEKRISAAGYGDQVIYLSDLNTRHSVKFRTDHTNPITRLVFSSDGNLLVSGSLNDGEIKIWDIASQNFDSITGSSVNPSGMAFSPDRSTLIYSLADTLHIVNLNSGNNLTVLDGHLISGGWAYSSGFAYTPDGKYFIAFNSQRNKLLVWEAGKQKIFFSYNIEEDEMSGIAISHKGNLLAIVSQEKISFIDIEKRTVIKEIDNNINGYLATFSSDDKKFILSGVHERISVWDITDGTKLYDVDVPDGVVSPAAISSDGKWLAVVDKNQMQVWDIEQNVKIWSHKGSNVSYLDDPWEFAFSPDGKILVFWIDEDVISIRETVTGKELTTLNAPLGRVVFSSDCVMLAISSKDGINLFGIR